MSGKISAETTMYDLEEGLQPKVPKNQGKKNAARSAHPLSGSTKTRHFLLLA